MYICGKHMLEKSRLKKDTIVSTVMKYLGFHKAVEAANMNAIDTSRPDRYVRRRNAKKMDIILVENNQEYGLF